MTNRIGPLKTILSVLATCLALPLAAAAQPAASTASVRGPLFQGECTVVINNKDGWGGTLYINGVGVPRVQSIEHVDTTAVVRLRLSLAPGERVSVDEATRNSPADGERVRPLPNAPAGRTVCPGAVAAPDVDEREAFFVDANMSLLIETFAPQREKLKLTALAASSGKPVTQEEIDNALKSSDRALAAASFDTHLLVGRFKDQKLWLLTRGWYGTRSSAVCVQTDKTTGAENQQACLNSDVPDPSKALVIVRHATTAEVYLGGRYEFMRLPGDKKFPSNLYAACTFGAVFINEVSDTALSNHACGFGAILIGGRYRESYAEVAWGKSEVFAPGRSHYDRRKADVFITARIAEGPLNKVWKRAMNGARPFFRFSLDRGDGPDALQTSFGFAYDFVRVFGTQ